MIKQLTIFMVLLVMLVGGVFSASTPDVVRAQDSANLLQNPGFEGEFVAIDGDNTFRVAEGWQPWNLPPEPGDASNMNLRPDYQPAPPTRVLSPGSGAQQYDTFFATHTGGIFQSVTLSQAGTVTFTANIYPYSSSSFEDIDESIDPQGLIVSVGIDPDGGTDGSDPGIIWSEADEYYDEYQEHSVSTVSTGTAVTVWVRSTVDGPNGLHQVFVDNTSLTLQADAPPSETPTEAPSETPSETPTEVPTEAPSETPTETPTEVSTETPSETPTDGPTDTPTEQATEVPTELPTEEGGGQGGPAVTETPAPVRPPYSDELPNIQNYVVRDGDTVSSIAVQLNSTADAIIEYNDLSESGLIFINQTLVVPVPAGQGQPVVTPAPGGGAGTGGEAANTYVVQQGDNLFRIALRFNMTTETLARYNGIINPALIYVGQTIRIPPSPPDLGTPGTVVPVPSQEPPQMNPPATGNFIIHVVQPGENIFRIGLRYNITWDVIARANGLFNPNFIVVGQHLIIPR